MGACAISASGCIVGGVSIMVIKISPSLVTSSLTLYSNRPAAVLEGGVSNKVCGLRWFWKGFTSGPAFAVVGAAASHDQ